MAGHRVLCSHFNNRIGLTPYTRLSPLYKTKQQYTVIVWREVRENFIFFHGMVYRGPSDLEEKAMFCKVFIFFFPSKVRS